MQITRTRPETRRAPAEWFTGRGLARSDRRRAVALSAARIQRALHARRAHGMAPASVRPDHPRHRRPRARAKDAVARSELIRTGDTVRFEPDEDHWHGAAPTLFMTHLALHEAGDDGEDARWGAHVTDDEYLQPTGAK
jgi:hypothetical protein